MSAQQRKWSEEEKKRHSFACTGKDRLTLAQKLEIIRLHDSPNQHEHKSQTQLADMFQVLAQYCSHPLQKKVGVCRNANDTECFGKIDFL